MELVLLSTLVSRTFRQRTKELFFGYNEAFENKEEETLDAARKAGRSAAQALRRHAQKVASPTNVTEKGDEDAKDKDEDAQGKAREAFETEKKDARAPMSTSGKVGLIIFLVISTFVGVYAAFLSWNANTVFEMSTVWKVVCSFFAFLGGISYLISYIVFRWKETEFVVNMKKFEASPFEEAESPIASPQKEDMASAETGEYDADADGDGDADAEMKELEEFSQTQTPKKEQLGGRRRGKKVRHVRKNKK